MKKIPLIRRKSLLGAGIRNSQLIDLAQRNTYFKNRTGDTSFFTPPDALLVFIAAELSDFLPFRNVSGVINDLVKNYRNLYRLLEKKPEQFLVVEKKPIAEFEEIGIEEMSCFLVYLLIADTLKVWDWENRKAMVLLSLKPILSRVRDLFSKEGIVVPTID